MDPRVESMAKILVEYSTKVQKGDMVRIFGHTPAAPLIEAGADFLAVSGGVWNHPEGPGAAVNAFNALFAP